MSSNPLVSILIPAYNSERWIKATIKSALAQSWQNKEIIIVDDGSKDNTFNVAKEFESHNVKVVTQQNSGASSARNKALSFAQGDFIQWLDSDDLLAPAKIELQLKSAGFDPENKTVYTSAWGFFFHSIKRAKFFKNNLWQNLSPIEWIMYHLGEGHFMFPAVWLVNRKLTETAGLWDESLSYNDDGEYFTRVVAASDRVCFVAEALSYHRAGNTSSLSNTSMSEKGYKSLHRSVNLCVDYLLKLEDTERTRKAGINVLEDAINTVYPVKSDLADENQKRILKLGGSLVQPVRTCKFKLIRNILGDKTAMSLKSGLWNLELIIRKSFDRLLCFLSMEKPI